MILILFLCIKLSILHLCVSDHGYDECRNDDSRNDPKIFLIEDPTYTNSYQYHFNSKFYELCRAYYDIDFLEQPLFHENVIQFAVPDYYKGKPLGNFLYAGNITRTDDVVCQPTHKTEPEFDCNEIVNLVSESVKEINDGHIYDFVQGMELIINNNPFDFRNPYYFVSHRGSCEPYYHEISDPTIVLLCSRANPVKELNIHPLTLIQVSDTCCRNYVNKEQRSPPLNMNRLLAVLAPKPFELPSEHSVPTIFYEAPYILSEDKAVFPNSMNLVPWHLLKYGFVKFLQAVGWQRVAIVTDDSEYSKDFEDELTALFREERLVYTVIRCEDANCDMYKMVQELSSVRARIVIANVEEKHAEYLIQHATRMIIWLLRDMAKERAQAASGVVYYTELVETRTKRFGNTFIMRTAKEWNSLPESVFPDSYNLGVFKSRVYRLFLGKRVSPSTTSFYYQKNALSGQDAFLFSFHKTKTRGSEVEDNILTGLSSIAQAYKHSKRDHNDKKPEFHRRFFDKVKRITPRITEAEIVVHRIWNSARVLSMSVNENGAKILHFENPYKDSKPSDGTAHCLVSTYDYNNSCEDPLVMFLMFTLMMFVLTFLLISCFFDKTSPFNDIRYQNF